jgi:hypothetical protein
MPGMGMNELCPPGRSELAREVGSAPDRGGVTRLLDALYRSCVSCVWWFPMLRDF